jgi:hypothetical protein
MFLKYLPLVAQIFLGIFLLFNISKKFREKHKILYFFLYLTAAVSVIYSSIYVFYADEEKMVVDKEFQEKTGKSLDWIDRGVGSVGSKVNELKSKSDKKGQKDFFDHDYNLDIVLKLDELNRNIELIRRTYRKDFIIFYYEDIEKIPDYFNYKEWEESEQIIYTKIKNLIIGDFSSRGHPSGSEKTIGELDKEREKVKEAKKRLLEN